MTERLEKLLFFLNQYFTGDSRVEWYGERGPQVFFIPNVVGDSMTSLYCADGIQVNECDGNMYIDILGLTDDEVKAFGVESGECLYPKR